MRENELKKIFILFGSILVGEVEIVRQMLNDGIDVNSRIQDISTNNIELDSKSATISFLDTPLLVALKHNARIDIITLLFESGADVTLEDQNGKNSLVIAVEKNLTEAIRLFSK